MRIRSHGHAVAAALIVTVLAGAAMAIDAGAGATMAAAAPRASAAPAPSVAAAKAPPAEPAPFARVYLAIRGCTSCSHCRSSIRQMVKSNAAGGEARLSADQVEIRYVAPRSIPLRGVIRSLAENRLHDLSLVDVLFEGLGTISTAPDGTVRFVLAGTGQAFPLAIDRAVKRPADGKSVRLVAVVDGWREKKDLSLTAREFRDES
jgi:hypothetical protein